MSDPIGLRERIKAAKTEAEVKNLLNEGSTYKTASDKTKRRWNDAFRNWTAPKAKKTEEAPGSEKNKARLPNC